MLQEPDIPGRHLSWPHLDAFSAEDIADLRRQFESAQPARHLVLDNLFPRETLQAILREFDLPDEAAWRESHNVFQKKRATGTDMLLPPVSQTYVDYLYSGTFLRFLRKVTGNDGLITDPSLFGGGLHEIPTGGTFELHRDFTRHPVTKLSNQLIVITYLNEGWTEDHGGALELWRNKPRRREKSVVPVFGRTIIMETTGESLHGHPSPICGPNGMPRRSIAAYFYANPAVAHNAMAEASTVYVARPGHSLLQKSLVAMYRMLPPSTIDRLKRLVLDQSTKTAD